MSPELIDDLREKFPEVFRLYNDPANHAEIACDDGWFNVIADLGAELSLLEPIPQVTFIKEKFGAIRFFFDWEDTDYDTISQFLLKAEAKSLQTCEICGADGARIDSHGVLKVVCAKHRNFMDERRRLRGF